MNREIPTILILCLISMLIAPIKIELVGGIDFTLQTLVFFSIAAIFKPRITLITIAIYLLSGALGLPVFAGFVGGWEKLIGPTAGFLWGFLISSAYLTYRAQYKEMHFFNAGLLAFHAHLILLALGFLVLYFLMPAAKLWPTFVNLLPGLLIKVFLIALLCVFIKQKLPSYLTTGVR
jgi:biotin transport system substrate-specific component